MNTVGKLGPGSMPRLLLVMTIALSLAACETTSKALDGGDVLEGQRILLQRGENVAGQWSTRDLLLNYRYAVARDQIDFAAQVRFTEMVTMGFLTLDRFHLKLYWLDQGGRVVTTQGLFSVSQTATSDVLKFQANCPVPASAAAFAFGYSGDLHSQGLNGGTYGISEVPTTAIGAPGR